MGTKAGIAISLVIMLIFVQAAGAATTASKTNVYIENADDDGLWVKVYLDGGYMGSQLISGGERKYFHFYRLPEGRHEFKIEWKDPDTCEWTEKTAQVEAAGADLEVTLTINPVSITECEEKAVTYKKSTYADLELWVKNLDDDVLFVTLTVDETRKRSRTIARYSESRFLTIFNMAPGTHEATIKWKEPDTKEWYEKTLEVNLTEGKNSAVIETEEVVYTHELVKPDCSIDVYVKNDDDDDLWVDVLVDSKYGIKKIKPGTTRHYKTFDKLYPGRHTLRLRWIDPDVKGWQENETVFYLDPGESAEMTAYTTEKKR